MRPSAKFARRCSSVSSADPRASRYDRLRWGPGIRPMPSRILAGIDCAESRSWARWINRSFRLPSSLLTSAATARLPRGHGTEPCGRIWVSHRRGSHPNRAPTNNSTPSHAALHVLLHAVLHVVLHVVWFFTPLGSPRRSVLHAARSSPPRPVNTNHTRREHNERLLPTPRRVN